MSDLKNVLVVSPGDPVIPSGSVSVALLQRDILARQFHTDLFFPVGLTPFTTQGSRIIYSLSWTLQLVKRLAKADGVVYVIDSVRFGIVASAFQKIFRRRYKLVQYFGQDNAGPAIFKWGLLNSIFARIFNVSFITMLRHADGVIINPVRPLELCARRYASNYAIVPGILIDTDKVRDSTVAANEVRRKLEIVNRFIVGLVGPFHQWNRSSIEYVQEHINEFLENISFLFIGKYNEADAFSDKRVTFAGHVNDFAGYLSACDCLLIPRLVEFGGPMNKMINAMACSRPVVTNNPEGVGVTDGVNVVISPLDKLPSAVNWLFRNPDARRELGRNARRYIEEVFSVRANEGRLVSHLREISQKR